MTAFFIESINDGRTWHWISQFSATDWDIHPSMIDTDREDEAKTESCCDLHI